MNFPPVTILVRSGDGKIKKATPSDEIGGAIRLATEAWGFAVLMLWLCRYCLHRAQACSSHEAEADMWIRRYKSLRVIK